MIARHGVLVRIEHWAVALSGIVLVFTGIGQLPMYQRYGLTKVPGFAWSGDFLLNLWLHYVAAGVFMGAIAFHVVHHGLRRETEAVPRRGDLRESARIIAATFGFGEEPLNAKFLAEQRVAYAVLGAAAIALSVTGMLKVARNAGWLFIPPALTWINTTLHTLAFALFALTVLAHLAAFVIPANRPLVSSMFTGRVPRGYAARRHPLWLVSSDVGRAGVQAEE